MSLNDSQAAGFKEPEVQQLDFNTAPVLRRRVPVTQRAFATREAALAADIGGTAIPATEAPPPPVAALEAAPPPPPAAVQSPDQAPVISVPAPAPTDSRYPPRANDRIAKLYGEARSAQEYNLALEQQIAAQNQRLDALLQREQARATNPAPYTNQFGSSPGIDAPQAGSQPAPLTRAEMQAMLANERQETLRAFSTLQSHNASRADAERDFPEVFSDPNLRASADRIWQSERHLQADPHGPYKVAAMVRGLAFENQRSATTPGTSVDVQKQALAGIGLSVPEGSGTPMSRDQRYQAALARARYTQLPSDFVLARNIQLGFA